MQLARSILDAPIFDLWESKLFVQLRPLYRSEGDLKNIIDHYTAVRETGCRFLTAAVLKVPLPQCISPIICVFVTVTI